MEMVKSSLEFKKWKDRIYKNMKEMQWGNWIGQSWVMKLGTKYRQKDKSKDKTWWTIRET